MVPNSQRFDTLFSWMDERKAIELLSQNISSLDNPGIKYIAATRLGACSSRDSLDALVLAATGDRENIFDSITRRKSIEALGRRRDLSTLPTIYDAMSSSDEQTIVNAVDTLINFGVPLDSQFKSSLFMHFKCHDHPNFHCQSPSNEGLRQRVGRMHNGNG